MRFNENIFPTTGSVPEPEPRAEIKLPPGAAGAEITNCDSGSFRFTTDLKKFYGKNHGS